MAGDTLLDSHQSGGGDGAKPLLIPQQGPFYSHLGLLKGAKENPGSWSNDGTGQLAVSTKSQSSQLFFPAVLRGDSFPASGDLTSPYSPGKALLHGHEQKK